MVYKDWGQRTPVHHRTMGASRYTTTTASPHVVVRRPRQSDQIFTLFRHLSPLCVLHTGRDTMYKNNNNRNKTRTGESADFYHPHKACFICVSCLPEHIITTGPCICNHFCISFPFFLRSPCLHLMTRVETPMMMSFLLAVRPPLRTCRGEP